MAHMMTPQNKAFEPPWAKPENWPEKRRAPGYPRRFVVPSLIVFLAAVIIGMVGFSRGQSVLVWSALAFFLIGHAIVYRLTLSRLKCPGCGAVVTLKTYPEPRGFFRFHCRHCNIVWLTGVQVVGSCD